MFDDLIGKPFVKNGNGDNGYDCYTLSQEVCRRIGINLPPQNYIDNLETRNDTINVRLNEEFVELEKPEPYCLVTFKIIPPFVSHIGVVLEDCKRFIHIMKKRCVCIEKLNNRFCKSKIEGYYRYVGTGNNSQESL